MRFAGINYARFSEKFHIWNSSRPPDERQAKKFARFDFLRIETQGRTTFEDRITKPPTMETLERFGAQEQAKEGVAEMLATIKRGMWELHGVEVVIGIATGAWSPVLRKTSLYESGLIDVVKGQAFKKTTVPRWERDPQTGENRMVDVETIQPDGAADDYTKPGWIDAMCTEYHINRRCIVFVGNGFSDKPAFAYAKKHGSAAIGVRATDAEIRQLRKQLTDPDPDAEQKEIDRASKVLTRTMQDRRLLQRLEGEGKIDSVCQGDFTAEGDGRRAVISHLERRVEIALAEARQFARDTDIPLLEPDEVELDMDSRHRDSSLGMSPAGTSDPVGTQPSIGRAPSIGNEIGLSPLGMAS